MQGSIKGISIYKMNTLKRAGVIVLSFGLILSSFAPLAVPTVAFAASPHLTVTAAGTGNGTVTSSDSHISCTATAGSTSGTCTFTYGANFNGIILTAAASSGSTFSG